VNKERLKYNQNLAICFFYSIALIFFAAIPTSANGGFYKRDFFYFDCNFSYDAIMYSLNKPKHIVAFYFMYKLVNKIFNDPIKTAGFVLMFSAGIEFMQAFIPYRSGALQDLLPNLIGIALAFFF
jgi:hypothetical protein